MTWNDMKDLWRDVTRRAKSAWSNSVLRRGAAKPIDGWAPKLSVETSPSQHEKVDNIS